MGGEEEAGGEEGPPAEEGLEAVGRHEADQRPHQTQQAFGGQGHASPCSYEVWVPGEAHDCHLKSRP